MSWMAVDVVLLPDEQMIRRVIAANAELVERFSGEIVLDPINCIPHVSLSMGVVDSGDITQIEQVLADLAMQVRLPELMVTSVEISENSRGEKISSFLIEPSTELLLLHERITEEMEKFFSAEVAPDMLFGDEPIAETTLEWIRNYRRDSSFERYKPHITIGYGQAEQLSNAIRFRVAKLATCHLGNHCTCRKILAEKKVII